MADAREIKIKCYTGCNKLISTFFYVYIVAECVFMYVKLSSPLNIHVISFLIFEYYVYGWNHVINHFCIVSIPFFFDKQIGFNSNIINITAWIRLRAVTVDLQVVWRKWWWVYKSRRIRWGRESDTWADGEETTPARGWSEV